jgi:Flp pilus assembly pilin Flp
MADPVENPGRSLADEEGASIVEYSLGLLLIAFVTIAAMGLFGDSLRQAFTAVSSSI